MWPSFASTPYFQVGADRVLYGAISFIPYLLGAARHVLYVPVRITGL